MAVGVSTTKVTGKLVFDLERGEDKTTRTIEVPNAIIDTVSEESVNSLQAAVNQMKGFILNGPFGLFIQPANWRDSNASEEQWATTDVRYEVTSVTVTSIDPTN